MAKVSDLKFNLKGKDYSIPVNCNSSGQFNANIPLEVADALRIREKITAITLKDLSEDFFKKIAHFKTLETTEELFILVAYHARGKYTYKSDGSLLFGQSDEKHKIDISFAEIDNALGLDFTVAIKQTIDGKTKWFKAKLGKDYSWFQKEEYSQPNIYHKQEEIWNPKLKRFKIIPFSETALQSLKFAEEKLRVVSEMLHKFISQDEESILLTLTNQKLLN